MAFRSSALSVTTDMVEIKSTTLLVVSYLSHLGLDFAVMPHPQFLEQCVPHHSILGLEGAVREHAVYPCRNEEIEAHLVK